MDYSQGLAPFCWAGPCTKNVRRVTDFEAPISGAVNRPRSRAPPVGASEGEARRTLPGPDLVGEVERVGVDLARYDDARDHGGTCFGEGVVRGVQMGPGREGVVHEQYPHAVQSCSQRKPETEAERKLIGSLPISRHSTTGSSRSENDATRARPNAEPGGVLVDGTATMASQSP